ncbi:hypothetical protein GTA08_BOTSDO08660 [Botryosphaeria dothidea]|uniref:Uncharacterized protein n=1 Tax=Botryosphaeria dothidea TaxID=55169 RepID=A0A8H4N1U9_9PEZI|nr:hypothetical protein GTA08_BOTSDO08660 [Botryosphaeria dothidea]
MPLAVSQDVLPSLSQARTDCKTPGLVSEISFDINAKVDKLKILREGRDELIVDGASTFGCTRIDEWQNTEHKQELWIDYKVRIRVGSFGTGSVWNIPAETWTEQNRENAIFAAGMDFGAKGIYVAFNFGKMSFAAGAGQTHLLAAASATAPPILLGMGAAAIVYFVPWKNLFAWFQGIFAGVWDWWHKWISHVLRHLEGNESQGTGGKQSYSGQPMHYA